MKGLLDEETDTEVMPAPPSTAKLLKALWSAMSKGDFAKASVIFETAVASCDSAEEDE